MLVYKSLVTVLNIVNDLAKSNFCVSYIIVHWHDILLAESINDRIKGSEVQLRSVRRRSGYCGPPWWRPMFRLRLR